MRIILNLKKMRKQQVKYKVFMMVNTKKQQTKIAKETNLKGHI